MNCQDTSSENAPSVTYLTETGNLFAARYGVEGNEWVQRAWVSKIKSSAISAHQVCVTYLVEHMVIQTKNCSQDMQHVNTYMFLHDA
jgi:hypothetical protein